MIIVVLMFGLVMLDPARVLLAVFVLYALSGPILGLQKKYGAK
jgi:CDP-diacylglycerol--serine O-phosphatidyltransferase